MSNGNCSSSSSSSSSSSCSSNSSSSSTSSKITNIWNLHCKQEYIVLQQKLEKFHNAKLTTGALSGDLARTIGSAKEDTTKPIVMNIANSYAAVLLDPELSV